MRVRTLAWSAPRDSLPCITPRHSIFEVRFIAIRLESVLNISNFIKRSRFRKESGDKLQ